MALFAASIVSFIPALCWVLREIGNNIKLGIASQNDYNPLSKVVWEATGSFACLIMSGSK